MSHIILELVRLSYAINGAAGGVYGLHSGYLTRGSPISQFRIVEEVLRYHKTYKQ